MSPNETQLAAAHRELQEWGYTIVRGAVSGATLQGLQREVEEALADAGNLSENSRKRQWVPLLSDRAPTARTLLAASWCSDWAGRLLGRPLFGIMADCYRACIDAKLHSDAPGHALKGLRFNIYLSPLQKGRGALSLLRGSHSARYHEMLAARTQPAACLFQDTVETDSGDVLIMDLRTFHFAVSGGFERTFASLFYYAVPETDGEAVIVRACTERNARAPKVFGRADQPLYPDEYLAWLATKRPDWVDALRQYAPGV